MSRRWMGAVALGCMAVVVLALGLWAGLRTGGSTTTQLAATTDGTASAIIETQTVPTQPTVTVVTTPTTTTVLPGTDKPLIQVGDGNTPEQFIIGALYQQALQREGYTVSLTRNIGTPQIALAALKQGSLDLFPEYLDQWNTQVAGLNQRFPSLAAAYAAGAAYAGRHGAVLLTPTPFSDTTGIVVTSQYAEANHLASVADLAAGPSIIFAAPLEFQTSPQGLPAVEKVYGFRPGYVQVVDIGSQYSWLESDNAQAAYASTTDPQLLGPKFKLLSDPDGVFGYGNVVPVTTAHLLATEGPALLQTIERIDAALTTSAMRGLNYEVEFDGHDPTEVASEFLQGQGISPPVQFAPVPATTTDTDTTTGETAATPTDTATSTGETAATPTDTATSTGETAATATDTATSAPTANGASTGSG